MPPMCSVSALNECLRNRIAVGLIASDLAAHALRLGTQLRRPGTTALTSPQRSAVAASYWRHRNQISRARFSPTMRARYAVPKPASNEPTRGPAWPKRAFSAAIVRSQSTCRTWPPPIAKPLTAAITGFGMSRISRCSVLDLEQAALGGAVVAGLGALLESPPAQNARSPAPVSTTAATSAVGPRRRGTRRSAPRRSGRGTRSCAPAGRS